MSTWGLVYVPDAAQPEAETSIALEYCALLRFTRLDPRAFNELCDPEHVSGEQARVRFRRQLIVGKWQGSELLQLLQQAWVGQRLAERRIQRGYGLDRR